MSFRVGASRKKQNELPGETDVSIPIASVSEPLYPHTSTGTALAGDIDRLKFTQLDTPISKASSACARVPENIPQESRNGWLRKQIGIELKGHTSEYPAAWARNQYRDKDLFKTSSEIEKFLLDEPLYDYKAKKWTNLLSKSITLEEHLYEPLEQILGAILNALTKIPEPEDPLPTEITSTVDDSTGTDTISTKEHDGQNLDDIIGSDDGDDPNDSDYIPDSDEISESENHRVIGPSSTREVRRGDKIHFMHVEDFDNCDQWTSPDFVFRATGSSFEVPPNCKLSDILEALGYTNIASFIEVKLSETDINKLLAQIGVYVRCVSRTLQFEYGGNLILTSL